MVSKHGRMSFNRKITGLILLWPFLWATARTDHYIFNSANRLLEKTASGRFTDIVYTGGVCRDPFILRRVRKIARDIA